MASQLMKLAIGALVVLAVVALFFGIGLAMAIFRAKTSEKDGRSIEDD
jgi:hypothetical protein